MRAEKAAPELENSQPVASEGFRRDAGWLLRRWQRWLVGGVVAVEFKGARRSATPRAGGFYVGNTIVPPSPGRAHHFFRTNSSDSEGLAASVLPLQCLTMDLTVAVEGVEVGEALEGEGEDEDADEVARVV